MARKNIEVKGSIETREDLEGKMNEYAQVAIALSEREAAMDEELRLVREQFQDQTTTLKLRLKALAEELRKWAQSHPEAFDEKKSLALQHGTIGFRTGNPSVKTPAGMDEERFCEALENAGCGAVVRTVRELDKEAVLRLRLAEGEAERHLLSTLTGEFGIKITQAERFYVEEKRDASDA